MSIEITGPQKYLFQDRVCVLLAIIHADNSNASLEIEPKDGEDAQLTLNLGGKQRILEVQIKGEKGTVDAIKLADWLSHFPSRKAENPLIERLINDRNRTAVIIASGRCDDISFPHIVEIDASMPDHLPGTIKTANAAASRTGFVAFGTKASSNDGPLRTKQRAYIAAMFSPTRTDLKEVLHRLLVVELWLCLPRQPLLPRHPCHF